MLDDGRARWLQDKSAINVSEDPAILGAWGRAARTINVAGHADQAADASALAYAIRSFWAAPVVEERIVISQLIDVGSIIGTVRTVTIPDHPIYASGCDVLVIGGGRDLASGASQIDILRRLT